MKIVIVGSGGFAAELASWMTLPGSGQDVEILGFLPVLGVASEKGLESRVLTWADHRLKLRGVRAVLGLGDPQVKQMALNQLAEIGLEIGEFVHPTAIRALPSTLGRGCVVMPYAIISVRASLGDYITVGCHAGIGHDTEIGDFCHIGSHSDICGHARVGPKSIVGTHAVVLPNVSLGEMSEIMPGSLALKDVESGGIMMGVPARKYTKNPQAK